MNENALSKRESSEPILKGDPSNFVFPQTAARGAAVSTNATGWRDIIQPDGKIVVIGAASTGGIVARYNADGSLDTSFATSGIFTSSSPWFIEGAIQSDGKVIAVGVDSGNFNIVRLNSDGTIDTSFGSGGSTQIDFGRSDYVMGVALAPDGKIVVAGPTITGGSGDFAIARLTTSGALDTSFNSTGKETLDLGDNDGPSGVLIQPSGKIVVVGQSGGGAYVVRFNASGGVDNSFGPSGNGKTYLYGDYAFRMNIQALSDDRLLVSGNEGGYLVLHRYSIDGIADTSFGTSGVVQTNLGGGADWAYDIGVQPDGKVITVGADYNGGADCAVVRYNVDGSVDTTFGSSGTMLIWYGSSSYSETDYFESVAIQPDGQIVAVGTANGKFALARMNGGLTRLYTQQDAVYNVTALVDVSGTVKQRMIYTPDGVMTVLSPTWGNTTDGYAWRYTFQDMRYDPATGMLHAEARDYGPNTGTWREQDPTGAMYIDGANLYQFTISNPIRFVDPFGLASYSPPFNGVPPSMPYSGPPPQQPPPPNAGSLTDYIPNPVEDYNAAKASAGDLAAMAYDPNASAYDMIGPAAGVLGNAINAALDCIPVVDVVDGVARKIITREAENIVKAEAEKLADQAAKQLAKDAEKCPVKSNAQLRKEWEQANKKPWPKDPKDPSRNQDVSHTVPKADGGSNTLDNIEPLPHDDHVQRHKDNGDFKRWGGRRKQ